MSTFSSETVDGDVQIASSCRRGACFDPRHHRTDKKREAIRAIVVMKFNICGID